MIKGWFTKHKDKWHQIEDVKDTGKPAHEKGGGNVVKLKGKDDWIHASDLSGMEPKEPIKKTFEKKYHIYKDGQRITAHDEGMTLKEIETKHGVKNLNNSGHLIKPIETNMKKTDKLKGGLADNKKPSLFDPKMLEMGINVEIEHTKDKTIAREIAMDHLTEDPQYYIKLKDIEKYDRIDEEADGKKEFDYGKEELNKRWKKLKKAVLDSSSSIMSIEDQEYHDEETAGESEGDQELDGDEASAAPPEDQPSEDQQVQAEAERTDDDAEEGSPSPEELEQMLRDEGYSDSEIAHIIHSHIPPEATLDDVKMDAEQVMSEHKMDHQKRMDELDYNLATHEHETNGLDKDHKKRMLDLEYNYAKKEKEMELKHKEKEFELKLESQRNKAEASKVRDTRKSVKQDAAHTSKKEIKGKK